MDDFQQDGQRFREWLVRMPGVSISPKIELADYRERGAGRGVRARRDIAADEDLFTIPQSSVISWENSSLRSLLFHHKLLDEETLEELKQDPFLALNLVLIFEYLSGSASRWREYFSILPQSFNTLIFWSDKELKELQASAVVHKVGKNSADELFERVLIPIIRKHEEKFEAFRIAAGMSDDDLKALAHRTGSIIMSYAFDIEKDEQDLEADEDGYAEDDDEVMAKAMVPLADMLNADADSNANLHQEGRLLIMKSSRFIKAGEEILNTYGQLPRSDLLRRYGYVTPKYSRYDCVEVSCDLLDECIGAHRSAITDKNTREAYLEDEELLDVAYDIVWPENSDNLDFFPDDLSRYVKTMLADEGKWKNVTKTGMCEDALLQTFKLVMADVIVKRQAEYPTSLEEDLALLEAGVANDRRRMASEVRVGEKRILQAALQRLKEDQAADEENGERASKKRRIA